MPLRINSRNKYRAKGGYYCSGCGAPHMGKSQKPGTPTACGGAIVYFSSKAEHSHFIKLLRDQSSGAISEITLQPRFDLVINGKKIGRYRADFKFFDKRKQAHRIQDVKGVVTRDGELRRKVVEALYGIEVELVR